METDYRFINRLANKQRRQFEHMLFPERLSGAQAKVLHFILSNEEMVIYQKDIEEEFGLRAPSATALLKNMEMNHLISKEVRKEDGRYKRIVATKKAQSYKSELFQNMELYEKRLQNGISPEDLVTWKKVCEQMLQNLA